MITLSSATDSFASAGITATSHGVVALNFNNGPTGVAGYEGSDMYLGAVGNRIFTSSGTFAAGAGGIYRFGGGAPGVRLEPRCSEQRRLSPGGFCQHHHGFQQCDHW